MGRIYLSPHLDDVALSCGGLVWEESQQGQAVQIWTICAGDPPAGPFSAFAEELHARWGIGANAVAARRQEDSASCAILGAELRHFSLPDAIYRFSAEGLEAERRYFYNQDNLLGPLDPTDLKLVDTLSRILAEALPSQAELVCPLALGGHVDHRLTRLAAERLGRPLWYYADYPYVLRNAEKLEELHNGGWVNLPHPISPPGLQVWQDCVAAHASQVSTFWPDPPTMSAAISKYCKLSGGVSLWRPAI